MAELKLGTTIGGNVAWHEGNDGSGSGLDADYLDGNHASAFALSGHTHSYLSAESDTLATVTGRGDNTGTLIKLTAATGGSTTTGTYALRVTGLSGYESLELGVQDNYQAVLRSYGNDIHYYAGHWRSTATASENHSHYWYTAKNGSTDWNSYKMRLDHNGALTVSSSGVFNGITINQERANNARIYSATTGAMGLLGVDSGGTFKWQVYGDGSNYGFLDSTWGNWDINKTINGNMTLRVSGSNYTVYHTGNVPAWITNSIGSNFYINNASPTIYLQDSDNRSSMIHCNSNYFYILRGDGTNSGSWGQYDGYWPLQIYLENNTAQFGGQITKRGVNVPALWVQDSAPSAYNSGDLWWQSSSGKLKIYYYDGNSYQWVDASPIPDTSTFYSKAGGAITGPVVIGSSLTVTGLTTSKKTNLTANGAGWDDHLNLYSSDGTNRWNVLVDSGASNRLRFAYNNSEKFYVTTGGDAYTSSSLSTTNLYASSTSNTYYYNVYAGDGYGVRFWSSDAYKISMGYTSSLYQYGTVTDYSIKTQMDDGSPGRGFTWGRQSYAPIASLNATSGNMQIAGSFTAGGNVTAYSDISLKTNVTLIENALDKVKAIRGVTYNRKDLENNPRQTGVIAQEVEVVLPEVVCEGSDGIKSVAYGNMVGLLIEAIKEQQKQIEELKAEVKALRG